MRKVVLYSQGVLFIGLILFVGGLSLALAGSYKASDDGGWSDGQQASVYEKHYDKQLPVRDMGINVWAAIEYVLFKEGRSGVVVGNSDWLFSSEEFKYYSNSDDMTQKNLAIISSVSKQLKKNNIKLVMAVIPAKARVYEEHISSTQPSIQANLRYKFLMTWLSDNNVTAIGLLDPLVEAKRIKPTYLRTDTHWTPWGAEIAAEIMANKITIIQPDLLGNIEYVSSLQTQKSHSGDLMSYIPLGDSLDWLGPQPEKITEVRTNKVESGEEEPLNLFDSEPVASIALVGTSYSANPSWNFLGFLKEKFGSDILNFAQEGKGPFEPMVEYLASAEFRDQPPKLVVWEFPERFLPVANPDAVYAAIN